MRIPNWNRSEPGVPDILMHSDVIQKSIAQIRDSPDSETGGKFLGFAALPGSPVPSTPYWHSRGREWVELSQGFGSLVVLGSISPGPLATRTATELLPDGNFQVGVFREIERGEPACEHLGSWHSHHPNGLSKFSRGDVEGYVATVQSSDYNLDQFLAVLCTEGRGLDRGHAELFLRRSPMRPIVLHGGIRVSDSLPSLQAAVEAAERRLMGGRIENSGQVAELNRRLRAVYSNVSGPIMDHESASWRVGIVGPPSVDLVVTYPGGSFSRIGISMRGEGPELECSVDFSLSSANSDLLDVLSKAMRSLGSTLSSGGS